MTNNTRFLLDCIICLAYNLVILYGAFYLVTHYSWSEWTFLAALFFVATPTKKLVGNE